MRVRGLGDGTSFFAAVVLGLTVLLVSALVWIGLSIKYAQAEEACIISRETYERHSEANGHTKLGAMPDEQVPGFIEAFNAQPPSVGPSDAVVAFRWSDNSSQPVTRLAFFLNGCLVDHYDVPQRVILMLMQRAKEGEEAGEGL